MERMLNRISNRNSQKLRGAFNINTLNRMNVLDKDCLNRIVSLRKSRNMLIHDIEVPEADFITKQGDEARELLEKLGEQFPS